MVCDACHIKNPAAGLGQSQCTRHETKRDAHARLRDSTTQQPSRWQCREPRALALRWMLAYAAEDYANARIPFPKFIYTPRLRKRNVMGVGSRWCIAPPPHATNLSQTGCCVSTNTIGLFVTFFARDTSFDVYLPHDSGAQSGSRSFMSNPAQLSEVLSWQY